MMNSIVKLLPSLSSALQTLSGFYYHHDITCEKVLSLVDFNDGIPTIDDVEASILEILFSEKQDGLQTVLRSFALTIGNLGNLYLKGRTFFDNIYLREPWKFYLNDIERRITEQLDKTNEASDELKEVRNSLEFRPFGGASDSEIAMLERSYELRKAEYEEERSILRQLYEERQRLYSERSKESDSLFQDIYRKCAVLSSVIEKYIEPSATDSNKKEVKTEESNFCFPMGLIAAVHELCDGQQFESILPIEFFNAINLQGDSKLTIRKGEKVRVCYLLSCLQSKLEEEKRNNWLNSMLAFLGIQMSFYRSKYREPVSDMPSRANENFAEALNEIMKNHQI